MKLTRTLLAVGFFAAIPLLHAEDHAAPKAEKAPPTEKADRKGGDRGGRGFGPDQQIARMEENGITLTDEQKTKIKAIYAKLQDVPQEERRAKMQETRDQVRAVLTAEQQAKYDAMPRGGRGGQGGNREKKSE